MGDLNINTLTQTKSNNTTNHLTNICDLFVLSNLVNVKTCTKSLCGSSLEIILTKKLRARSLVVSNLRSETKGSRFESGC